ncbi:MULTISPECIES: hypothetical protein [Priestia]|jgi:hypothetical protein|uniref:hypothetical protein n=1 Tax=Priestia TaxID=2800373 RepID=UPI00087FB977|nr:MULTISPECIES: hypothetical protein [Priestia]SDE29865.1 hypothetical protein SAMN04487777_1103 [Priestia aryabhattai B8W22]MCM3255341.1 hypothetical protein [Priestia aryabhattai]MCM3644404.1 hypothetical protein [Priestia aryabhattai]PFW71658.1 hypothetical protein COL23_27495 [Priestia aryabhattai]UYP07687.1 hypothetical protein OIJ04_26785 [Priestia megaterium]
MLQSNIQTYIEKEMNVQGQSLSLYQEEKEYALQKKLVPQNLMIEEKEESLRFKDSYIERVDKETDELIAEESPLSFLDTPISYLKEHRSEFLYVESKWFEFIKLDGCSFEVDDVFGTYKVLTGLHMQKKFGSLLKQFFAKELNESPTSVQLLFNDKDGLWDVNIELDAIKEFNEKMSIGEVLVLIYRFFFHLAEYVENEKA